MSKAKETTYKRKPVLVLNPDENWPFSFGLFKARLIVDHIDEIRAFVNRHGSQTAGPAVKPETQTSEFRLDNFN